MTSLPVMCAIDNFLFFLFDAAWVRSRAERPSVSYIFFYCKAELAIKPCRSSRSNTHGGFEKFHDTCKAGNKNTTKQTTTPQPNSPKHQQNKQAPFSQLHKGDKQSHADRPKLAKCKNKFKQQISGSNKFRTRKQGETGRWNGCAVRSDPLAKRIEWV